MSLTYNLYEGVDFPTIPPTRTPIQTPPATKLKVITKERQKEIDTYNELRLYTLSHYMIGQMAKGIQTLHSTVRLFVEYDKDSSQYEMLKEWAENHETVIHLNGGISPELNELYEFLTLVDDSGEMPFPYAKFHEDESLGKLMTAISMVLPGRIFNAMSLMRQGKVLLIGDCLQQSNSLSANEIKMVAYYNETPYMEGEKKLIEKLMYKKLAS